MATLRFSKTLVINAYNEPPTALEIGFENPNLSHKEMNDAERVITYWVESTAITSPRQRSINFAWNQRSVVTVFANFGNGNFGGDLLRHEAVGLGDEQFTIGLVRLFLDGYEPKTRAGKGCDSCLIVPAYIRFIYSKSEGDLITSDKDADKTENKRLTALIDVLLEQNADMRKQITLLGNLV